jgi:adenylate cyclase
LFWQQTSLILIVWTHLCVGLHFWLRVKPFYSRWSPLLQAIAVVVPLLGWLGFIQAGKLVERMANTPGWLKGTRMELL